MPTNTYHHGDLRQQLIDRGLELLEQEGWEGVSIRKVADRCGVSHAAPYRHFKNKQELLQAMGETVWRAFATAIDSSTTQHEDPKQRLIAMGKNYVRFLIDHPTYRSFIFLSEQAEPIRMQSTYFTSSVVAFDRFEQGARNYLRSVGSNPLRDAQRILLMWSMVHGMAVLIANQNIIIEEELEGWVEGMLSLYLADQHNVE